MTHLLSNKQIFYFIKYDLLIKFVKFEGDHIIGTGKKMLCTVIWNFNIDPLENLYTIYGNNTQSNFICAFESEVCKNAVLERLSAAKATITICNSIITAAIKTCKSGSFTNRDFALSNVNRSQCFFNLLKTLL